MWPDSILNPTPSVSITTANHDTMIHCQPVASGEVRTAVPWASGAGKTSPGRRSSWVGHSIAPESDRWRLRWITVQSPTAHQHCTRQHGTHIDEHIHCDQKKSKPLDIIEQKCHNWMNLSNTLNTWPQIGWSDHHQILLKNINSRWSY